VLGLTLGQFIANLGVEASPIAMVSPIVSFIGLLVIRRLRKTSVLAGCIAYIILTGIWLTYLLPLTSGVSTTVAASSAFLGQTIAVLVGYVGYVAATRTRTSLPYLRPHKTERPRTDAPSKALQSPTENDRQHPFPKLLRSLRQMA
jgi:hypothetical protein